MIELSISDRPSEPMASQCWLSMQVGCNLRQLVETFQLLQNCNWTSTIAEQQHGRLAALKRTHPENHEDSWQSDSCCRSRRRMNNCLHGRNSLRTSPIESEVARRIFAALARHAGRTRKCHPRKPTIRARAGARWSLGQEGASERGVWEKEANSIAICRKKKISDALDEVQDETLGLRKRTAGRLADRRQMSMAEAAFTPSMLARFKMQLATFQPSKRDLAAVRKKVVHVPPCPSHAERGNLLPPR